MTTRITFKHPVRFKRERSGRKTLAIADPAPEKGVGVAGRVPRISRLMALAIRFDEMIRSGEIRDYAELARLGHVTRARLTQIMNLLNLAPDIQEELLLLPKTRAGRDLFKEWQIRPLAARNQWRDQRSRWKRLKQTQTYAQ